MTDEQGQLSATDGLRIHTEPASNQGSSEKNYETILKPSTSQITEAKNDHGRRIFSDQVTDSSVINVRGQETTVAAASRAGLIEKGSDGMWNITDRGSGRKAPEPPEAAVDYLRERPELADKFNEKYGQGAAEEALQNDGAEVMDSETENQITEVAETTNPNDIQSLISDAATGNDFSEETLGRIASHLGQEPEQVRETAQHVRQAFASQARGTVEHEGVDADEFLAWAYRDRPEQIQAAIRKQATERSTQGYRELAQEFATVRYADMARNSPETLLQAEYPEGVTAFQAPNGEVVLEIDGFGQVPFEIAQKKGWVSVSQK